MIMIVIINITIILTAIIVIWILPWKSSKVTRNFACSVLIFHSFIVYRDCDLNRQLIILLSFWIRCTDYEALFVGRVQRSEAAERFALSLDWEERPSSGRPPLLCRVRRGCGVLSADGGHRQGCEHCERLCCNRALRNGGRALEGTAAEKDGSSFKS